MPASLRHKRMEGRWHVRFHGNYLDRWKSSMPNGHWNLEVDRNQIVSQPRGRGLGDPDATQQTSDVYCFYQNCVQLVSEM